MRPHLALMGLAALLVVACSSSEGLLGDRAAITCSEQTGMTGDLARDLSGTWRLAWSGEADGGPSETLVVFAAGGDAEMYSERFGHTEWSWSIHGDEVRMWNHEGDSHLFTTKWAWVEGEWTWSAIGYGTTELARCASTAS